MQLSFFQTFQDNSILTFHKRIFIWTNCFIYLQEVKNETLLTSILIENWTSRYPKISTILFVSFRFPSHWIKHFQRVGCFLRKEIIHADRATAQSISNQLRPLVYLPFTTNYVVEFLRNRLGVRESVKAETLKNFSVRLQKSRRP